MFKTLHCNTADEIWLAAAGYFKGGGEAKSQMSRAGATLEVLHAALSIENPRQRWIASREPAMSPAFALPPFHGGEIGPSLTEGIWP
jgi:hypothetical protein